VAPEGLVRAVTCDDVVVPCLTPGGVDERDRLVAATIGG
jgi:hypothetical protein